MRWPAFLERLDARQRYLVMPLSAMVLGLFWFVAIDPFLDYREALKGEIETNSQRIQLWESYLSRAGGIARQRQTLQQRRQEMEQQLVPGGTATLAAATLQDKLHGFAHDSGINVQSTQVMREETIGDLRKISIRMTVTGQVRPLAEFLTAVEYGTYRVTIPFMEISRRGARLRGQGGRALGMTLEVSAFLQSTSAGSKQAEET